MTDRAPLADAATVPADASTPAAPEAWIGLYVLSIACMLYSMDLSVLFLAIPSIVRDLDPTPTQLLWINDIYGFFVAGFLITMGSLGDRIGRRRVLLIGAAAFGAASILCAFSTSASMLIFSRALLGIAGATIAPSTLSLIMVMFSRDDERTRAIGIWGTAFSVGGLAGPVIGGVLLQWFHWGSVFLVNVPIMAALLLAGPRLLPEYKAQSADELHPLDFYSVALSLLTVLPFIYGIKLLAAYGPSVPMAAAVVAGLAFGHLFLDRQRRLADPLIDLALFKMPRFSTALLVNLVGIFVAFAIFLFQAQFYQLVLGLDPLTAGLWSVIPSAVFTVMSLYAYKVIDRIGPEQAVVWGLTLFAVASGLMTVAVLAQSLYGVIGASMLVAIGFVPVILTTTQLIVTSAPPERAGSASAISETSAEFGGALGVGVLGSLGTWVYRTQMADVAAPEAARTTLNTAIDLAAGAAPPWLAPARDAFATGYALTCGLAAVALLGLSAFARTVFKPGEKV